MWESRRWRPVNIGASDSIVQSTASNTAAMRWRLWCIQAAGLASIAPMIQVHSDKRAAGDAGTEVVFHHGKIVEARTESIAIIKKILADACRCIPKLSVEFQSPLPAQGQARAAVLVAIKARRFTEAE